MRVACLFDSVRLLQRKSHERECRSWLLVTQVVNYWKSRGALIYRLATLGTVLS